MKRTFMRGAAWCTEAGQRGSCGWGGLCSVAHQGRELGPRSSLCSLLRFCRLITRPSEVIRRRAFVFVVLETSHDQFSLPLSLPLSLFRHFYINYSDRMWNINLYGASRISLMCCMWRSAAVPVLQSPSVYSFYQHIFGLSRFSKTANPYQSVGPNLSIPPLLPCTFCYYSSVFSRVVETKPNYEHRLICWIIVAYPTASPPPQH